jgi:hypothetical protein
MMWSILDNATDSFNKYLLIHCWLWAVASPIAVLTLKSTTPTARVYQTQSIFVEEWRNAYSFNRKLIKCRPYPLNQWPTAIILICYRSANPDHTTATWIDSRVTHNPSISRMASSARSSMTMTPCIVLKRDLNKIWRIRERFTSTMYPCLNIELVNRKAEQPIQNWKTSHQKSFPQIWFLEPTRNTQKERQPISKDNKEGHIQ